jgi:nitric oxide reductase NorD protein
VTDTGPQSTDRFRLLATFIAGRAVDVAWAAAGEAAHTDGQMIFVSMAGTAAEHRRQVLLQSALLGAGSLAARRVKELRARPSVARRYLTLEGHRVLAGLAEQLPLAAAVRPDVTPTTTTADESLRIARSPATVADPPDWFGVIKPSRLLAVSAASGGTRPTGKDLRLALDATEDAAPDDDEDDEDSETSKILKLFENPLTSSRMVSDFLRKLLGKSRSRGDNAAGAELEASTVRRVHTVSPQARPLPTQIHVTDDGKPATALGIGAALHPEWDTFSNRYRPDWCRVITFPLTTPADVSAADVARDDVLRGRLSRVGLGPKVLRARADGDELDIEALIGLVADMRSGHSPPQHIYTERRKLARDLGVLVLLDASGSVTDMDPSGLAVHEHQRRAAATLAATLEELGDRVGLYAFRSQGRHNVHLLAIKTFEQRFGAAARARLNQLQPSGYTRLGAAIRGAAETLKTQSGTPNRLLLVLSDGFPYDHGYEGRYAEADANKALEELRSEGVACLYLSLASAGDPNALDRVFDAANHVSASTLSDLSPRMDELFLLALRELAAPAAQ